MAWAVENERGFSLTELMLTVTVAATLLAIGVPVLRDVTEGSKLNGAARELEREFHSARLRAVSANRSLRVRLNCPAAGYYRTVEVLGTAADTATNRCLLSAYPFPADADLTTRPNYDGPHARAAERCNGRRRDRRIPLRRNRIPGRRQRGCKRSRLRCRLRSHETTNRK